MGKLVAFSGPDGSGKTTQVRLTSIRLQSKGLKTCQIVVFDYLLLKYPLFLIKKFLRGRSPQKTRKSGVLGLLWPLIALLDHWLYFLFRLFPLKLRYDYVLCDRYFIDMATQAKYRGFVSDAIWKIYLAFLPKSDIAIFFHQSAQKSYYRSGKEFEMDYFKLQNRIYREIAEYTRASIIKGNKTIREITKDITDMLTAKRLKGVYLVSGIVPSPAGGVFIVYEIIKKLSQKGVLCTIITPIYEENEGFWREWAQGQEKKYGIQIITLDAPGWLKHHYLLHHLISQLRMAVVLLFTVFKDNYSFIHEFTSTPILSLRSKLVSILSQTKTFVTISTYYDGFWGTLRPLRLYKIDKTILPNKSLFKKSLKLGIKKDRLALIPFGIYPQKFLNVSKTKACQHLGLPTANLTVLYTGPITKRKGTFQYARVINTLSKQFPQVNFVFIASRGQGRFRYSRQRKQVEKLFSDKPNIYFLEGAYPKEYIFNAAEVVVVPQQNMHGTIIPPITLLEAMASKCAVIGTDILGINEVIKDGRNGLVYNKNKDGELQSAIVKLLKDKKLRRRLSKQAQKEVSGLTLDLAAERYYEFYKTNPETNGEY